MLQWLKASRWAAVLGGLALLCASCGKHTPPAGNSTTATPAAPDKPATSASSTAAKSGQPYENSLGMKFVPLPGTKHLFSIWETRLQDYKAFLSSGGLALTPAQAAHLNYPVTGVTWEDAVGFCEWLTAQERQSGRIGPQDRYRLPRDREWDIAVGKERYPWGSKWPKVNERQNLPGFVPDNHNLVAPVGSFPPNQYGIYDLNGNALEWCHDSYARELNPPEIRLEYKRLDDDGGGNKMKVLRGNSWLFFDPMNLLTTYRYVNKPNVRGALYGFRCVLEFDSLATSKPAKATRALPDLPTLTPVLVAGRDLYLGKCGECHQYYDPASYNAEDWSSWMDKMRAKAKLNNVEYDEIVRFLRVIRDPW